MTTQGGEAACSVLGLDIGATQLDACLLINDRPPLLRREVLAGKTPIDRVRAIPEALMRIMAFEPDPDWITIEIPKGDRIRVMVAQSRVVGAITACLPPECQINWHTASEWRHVLGAANSKEAGATVVLLHLQHHWGITRAFDEHELDAIGIALAWQRILAQQEAA